MATTFAVSRVEGDNEARGSDSTVTRITYSSPPPRSSIKNLNDDARYRKLLYGRGTNSVLLSTTYPQGDCVMAQRAAKYAKAPPVYLEPRFTPPDCADAQDLATGKAAILEAQVKLTQLPRRDSGVSAELEPAIDLPVEEKKASRSRKRSRPSDDAYMEETGAPEKRRKKSRRASSTPKSPKAAGTSKPTLKISRKRPANAGAPDVRTSSNVTENKLPSSSSSYGTTVTHPASDSSTPPSDPSAVEESARISPIVPTIESHSREEVAAPPARVPRKLRNKSGGDDLTIYGNFDGTGVEGFGRMREFRKGKHWYRQRTEVTPEWAEEERPVVDNAPTKGGRRSTARAMSLRE